MAMIRIRSQLYSAVKTKGVLESEDLQKLREFNE